MDRLSALQVFTEVADRGSLTAAGESLDMSRAMVSRYLQDLERWLGVRLFHRSTRRVTLTDAGEEALPRCRQMLELAQSLQSTAGERRSVPRGRLRITASPSFAQSHLAGAISQFLTRYPQVQVELIATEHAVNLVEERIDLALRIGNVLDATLLARRLGACRSALCASPGYLAAHGAPAVPAELRSHRVVGHAYIGRNEYRLHRDGLQLRVPVSASLSTNEVLVMRAATLAGAGIALLPTYCVADDLVAGRLQRVLPEYEPEPLGIHALYLSRQHQPLLLRLMIDHLVAHFGSGEPPWDRALAAAALPRRRTLRRRTARGKA